MAEEEEPSPKYCAFTNAHPFQRLCSTKNRDGKLLLAAAGPRIYSYDISHGSLLSYWPSEFSKQQIRNGASLVAENGLGDDEEPPGKKRRLSSPDKDPESRDTSVSVEIVVDKPPKGSRQKTKVVDPSLPNVSHLVCTSDSKHAVAITAEDKCVRIFQIDEEGNLIPQSERCMPKRPCAVVITPDDSTLLVGDKFGDVYSLPLHFVPSDDGASEIPDTTPSQVAFKPSASELTVHTKGNLEALRQQRESKAARPQKSTPAFEYTLILGHVSLLTDLQYTEVPGPDGGRSRSYLLTSDRDEHIRVSRGPPQGHIIEHYCLGHTEFISKLCVMPWAPEILVSGGGDNCLMSWDWQRGQLLHQVEILDFLERKPSRKTRRSHTAADEEMKADNTSYRLPVSGIWPTPAYKAGNPDAGDSASGRVVLVALEGVSSLLSFLVDRTGHIKHHQTIELSGNVLDVAFLSQRNIAIISVDNVHEPGSTQDRKEPSVGPPSLVEAWRLYQEGDEWLWGSTSLIGPFVEVLYREGTFEVESTPELASKTQKPSLADFLYGLENLRKNMQVEHE